MAAAWVMLALVSMIIAGSAEFQGAACPELTSALSRIAELEEEVARFHGSLGKERSARSCSMRRTFVT